MYIGTKYEIHITLLSTLISYIYVFCYPSYLDLRQRVSIVIVTESPSDIKASKKNFMLHTFDCVHVCPNSVHWKISGKKTTEWQPFFHALVVKVNLICGQILHLIIFILKVQSHMKSDQV